jgi:hypothetical protein
MKFCATAIANDLCTLLSAVAVETDGIEVELRVMPAPTVPDFLHSGCCGSDRCTSHVHADYILYIIIESKPLSNIRARNYPISFIFDNDEIIP